MHTLRVANANEAKQLKVQRDLTALTRRLHLLTSMNVVLFPLLLLLPFPFILPPHLHPLTLPPLPPYQSPLPQTPHPLHLLHPFYLITLLHLTQSLPYHLPTPIQCNHPPSSNSIHSLPPTYSHSSFFTFPSTSSPLPFLHNPLSLSSTSHTSPSLASPELPQPTGTLEKDAPLSRRENTVRNPSDQSDAGRQRRPQQDN